MEHLHREAELRRHPRTCARTATAAPLPPAPPPWRGGQRTRATPRQPLARRRTSRRRPPRGPPSGRRARHAQPPGGRGRRRCARRILHAASDACSAAHEQRSAQAWTPRSIEFTVAVQRGAELPLIFSSAMILSSATAIPSSSWSAALAAVAASRPSTSGFGGERQPCSSFARSMITPKPRAPRSASRLRRSSSSLSAARRGPP